MDVLLAAREILRGNQQPNILSFGCSIGDEVATLRSIFPKATIHGCDISPEALAVASATTGHLAGIFVSSEAEIMARGPFDLICAFSSLCLNPLPKSQTMVSGFPFSQFDEMTGLLTQALAPGGLLALRNPSYLLSETACFSELDVWRVSTIYRSGTLPLFRKDYSMALDVVRTMAAPVHRFHNVTGLTDWDFIDCIFGKCRTGEPSRIRTLPMPLLPLPERAIATATWSRSNLDVLLPGTEETGLIELRSDYTIFHPADHGEGGTLQCTVHRSAMGGDHMEAFGPVRWLISL